MKTNQPKFRRKYYKKILKELTVEIDSQTYSCIILSNKDYYNIHVIDDHRTDNERNTLHLQEPKDHITLYEMDEDYMLARILEVYLWNKTYGLNNKIYTFGVDVHAAFNLPKE